MPVLSAPRTRTRTRHTPLALWHLLSLDAPTVAALWTWFIARSSHLHLSLGTISSMALAVWTLYAADRLLDARTLVSDPLQTRDLEHRHRFHHLHRRPFLLGILAASLSLSLLIPRLDPAALHLYLILGALLAAYFLLIHVTGSAHRLPKEIAVGLFFSAAVFIPTVARIPSLRLALLPSAALFAFLCSLNCLFIYAWEHTSPDRTQPHPATRLALQHLSAITLLCGLAGLIAGLASATFAPAGASPRGPWSIPLACTISCAALLLLHHHSQRLSPLTRRAAADLALLTPVLFLALPA